MDATAAEQAVIVRSVDFFAHPDQMAEIERRINDDVLPRFSELPDFMGFLALLSTSTRPEIIAMSFWHGGLENSEAVSETFRDEIEGVTGAAPSRKEFKVIAMVMRSEHG